MLPRPTHFNCTWGWIFDLSLKARDRYGHWVELPVTRLTPGSGRSHLSFWFIYLIGILRSCPESSTAINALNACWSVYITLSIINQTNAYTYRTRAWLKLTRGKYMNVLQRRVIASWFLFDSVLQNKEHTIILASHTLAYRLQVRKFEQRVYLWLVIIKQHSLCLRWACREPISANFRTFHSCSIHHTSSLM